MKVIVKVATQGQAGSDMFVTSYKLATDSGRGFEVILSADGSERVFPANTNDSDVVEHCLDSLQAFAVRLSPVSWYNGIALQWEIYTSIEGIQSILLRSVQFQ